MLTLTAFGPAADGVTDDTPAFRRLFECAAQRDGARIVIPPGVYHLAGSEPIPLASRTSVEAHGARFVLPQRLGDGAHLVFFSGRDVTDFTWSGGEIVGNCFDHRAHRAEWAPNVNTRVFLITTSAGGKTARIRFADVRGFRVGGAVVTVLGAKRGDADVHTYAEHVQVEGCIFEECGKFMWDYGLLWQIVTWPEDYAPQDVELAKRYFRNDLIHGPLRMSDGDDRILLDNRGGGLGVSERMRNDALISFFGDRLPDNITRGKAYAIVDAGPEHLRIAERPGEAPLRFHGSGGREVHCISRLHEAYYGLFSPTGCGPGKGGVDVVGCRYVRIAGCHLSALGDTMHIRNCRDITFTGNHIVGSRMGAFFLAEYCQNATITGNTVEGGNGSRVMSVERSATDVTIVGNTFRNGGRGSWINQPQRIVMAHNVFINNTTKGEPDPWRGRKSLDTGDYTHWAELYFTTYEPEGTYGPAIVEGNIFVTGPQCADTIAFAARGHDLSIVNNVFDGHVRTIRVEPGCEPPLCANNHDLEQMR